ncbi:hypothetical protein KAOT1_06857 [Kordia algicida OT-1]|uniref:Uncharacterized protein n=1 Tax=Kordia algicida OT-1 TaxID=391587 RepID=A9E5I1_9FLAO|nr:hypothetical protein KAOT1_06857 [Kordia algicida OT-1]
MLEKFKKFSIQQPNSVKGGSTATDDLAKWRKN